MARIDLVDTITNEIKVRTPPTQTGFGTRQSRISPNIPAENKRHVMRWIVPEQPVIEMYINPQNIQIQKNKIISEQRTKGGFALQYWGEQLINITISGTTGTSGIEGINVLDDIYRNEQLMFDPYALTLESEYEKKQKQSFDTLLSDTLFDSFGSLTNSLDFLGGSGISPTVTNRPKPTLASLAFTVEMYWMGEIYRGFFKSFSITEDSNSLGLFNYNINFAATQKRGFRTNFMPWHKSPNGSFGTPPKYRELSYDQAKTKYVNQAERQTSPAAQEIIDAFNIF